MARKGAMTRSPAKSESKPPPGKGAGVGKPPPSAAKPPPPAANKPPPAGGMTFKHEENQAAYNQLSPNQQARYRRILQDKGRGEANKWMGSVTGSNVVMPGQKAQPAGQPPAFGDMSTKQQNEALYEGYGGLYNQAVTGAQNFDVNNPMAGYGQAYNQDVGQATQDVMGQAGQSSQNFVGNAGAASQNILNQAGGYEQGFNSQLESARKNVMDQFERTMAPQFQREQSEFQQRMAEQGIDPNSGAYQAQYKAMMDSQNSQRLNAQSQAFQLGAGYQQQGFGQFMQGQQMGAGLLGQGFEQSMAGQQLGMARQGQGYGQMLQGQMLPFQQIQAAEGPWKYQYLAQQEARQNQLNRQAQLQQARIGAGASVRAAQIGAEASMNRANLDAINEGYPNQQKPNLTNDIIRGGVAGATAGMMR
jgi:hypothetical protein